MSKVFLFIFSLLFISISHAEYFYYWADEYEASRSVDGSVFINTHLKSSDSNTFTFSVNGYVIAKDVEMMPGEIVDFPVSISNKYTKDSLVTVCSYKQTSDSTFQQQVCLAIKLYD